MWNEGYPPLFLPPFFFYLRIIATLEKLKQEAAEITRKVEETDVVMAEVEAVSDQYGALSHYCSSIYFTMEGLNLVSHATKLCDNVLLRLRCIGLLFCIARLVLQ